MNYSIKISERHWNLPEKGELESKREQNFIDDIVQKSHIEKTLVSNLHSIKTVFDGGAGSGRFSILLAKLGLQVTHFGISQSMIVKAKELAEEAGVSENITFVQGALEDLSIYKEKSFDLVISFDSPISYTWPNQELVIKELVRICKKKIVISVTSRLGSLPYLANPIQKNQFILDQKSKDYYVQWCLSNKEKMINNFEYRKDICNELLERGIIGNGEQEIEAYDKGEAPWVITYAFMPNELESILQECKVKNIHLAGPGAYARALPNEILVKIMNDVEQKEDFLEFCYIYDSNPYVCGMGKDNLLAYGEVV